MITVTVIAFTLLAFALATLVLQRRYPNQDNALVEKIHTILPQTQCAQCGYPGCEPYAQALARDNAPPNLCPPGGENVFIQLTELLGEQSNLIKPPQESGIVAVEIDEAECIGCTLCMPPCPVDAIVGAKGMMHTVVKSLCTGCELCIPACPVDIIHPIKATPSSTTPAETHDHHCIGCGLCLAPCPVHLNPQLLFNLVDTQQLTQADNADITRCIECGLCDDSCPSEIPLSQIFEQAKTELEEAAQQTFAQDQLKQRFDQHQLRLSKKQTPSKRSQRLRQKRRWG